MVSSRRRARVVSTVDRPPRALVPAARFVTANRHGHPSPQGGPPFTVLPVKPNGGRAQTGYHFRGDAEVNLAGCWVRGEQMAEPGVRPHRGEGDQRPGADDRETDGGAADRRPDAGGYARPRHDRLIQGRVRRSERPGDIAALRADREAASRAAFRTASERPTSRLAQSLSRLSEAS
jgi:hypothetical protein